MRHTIKYNKMVWSEINPVANTFANRVAFIKISDDLLKHKMPKGVVFEMVRVCSDCNYATEI